jgi:hypothetical protein
MSHLGKRHGKDAFEHLFDLLGKCKVMVDALKRIISGSTRG